MKNFDSDAEPKYWWDGGQPQLGADVYNVEVCGEREEVWLVEGEPDVWIAHQVGIPAVSFTTGANQRGAICDRIRRGVSEIVATGVRRINIVPDNDEAGISTAYAVAAAFRDEGIVAYVRPLPAEAIGQRGDLTDLYRAVQKDDARLVEALRALPNIDPPEGRPSPPAVATAGGKEEWTSPIPLMEVSVPQFPVAVLPPWLRRMVEGLSVAIQTPVDLAAMFALTVLATIWSRRIVVEVRYGWVEPLMLYAVSALESGSRKTAVCNAMVAPIRAHEKSERGRERADVELRRLELKALEDRLRQVQSALAKADSEEERGLQLGAAAETQEQIRHIGRVRELRLLADNVTPEKLVSLLAEQEGRMAMLDAEGGLFGVLTGRYSARPDLTTVLKSHTGEEIRVDRIGRASEVVERPALVLGLAVQPKVLEQLTSNPELRGTGVLARFLYFLPPRHVGRRKNNPPPLDQGVEAAYEETVTRLLERASELDGDGPHTLFLTEDAEREIGAWMDWIEPRLAEFGELGSLADWGAKLAGHTMRIAALLHLAEFPDEERPWLRPLDATTVRLTIEVGRYLVPHARAAHAMMGQDPTVADAAYVWRWIADQGADELSARDVFEGTKGRFRRMRLLRPALDLLVEHGYLREQEQPPRSGPGRKPSPKYEVNPTAREHYSHNSRNAAA